MKKCFTGARGVALVLTLLLIFPAGLIGAPSPSAATTEVEHKAPGKEYIPGFRIDLEAEITDDTGLLATRCYFKTKNDENFAFVDMFNRGGDLYQATLPAPFVNSEKVEYLFVVVNNNKQVTRTQIFVLEEGETEEATAWKDIDEVREVRLDKVQDVAEKYVLLYNKAKSGYIKNIPDFQSAVSDTTLSVKTELAAEQVPVRGFSDSAMVTEVPATAKYGFLAENLYTADAIAASGGVAAAGTTAGTVAAAGGGMSGLGIAGIVAGAAVVGGGAAYAISESDDDDDDDHHHDGGTADQGDLQGQSGDVRINLQWTGCNDLDLHVVDPCGNEIYYSHKSATCQGYTGTLDIDANASTCSSSPAENIVWTNGAPSGNYTVRVVYYGGTGSSSYSVAVINGGSRTNYSGTISSGTQTVTTFSH